MTDAADKGQFIFVGFAAFWAVFLLGWPVGRGPPPPADQAAAVPRIGAKKETAQKAAQHIQYIKLLPRVSRQFVRRREKSVFCINRGTLIRAVSHVAKLEKSCYIIVRKGDTNVQVKIL